MRTALAPALALVWLLGASACGDPTASTAAASTAAAGVKGGPADTVVRAGTGTPAAGLAVVPAVAPAVGHWRMELASPGGPLPFEIEVSRGPEGLAGEMINGEERLPLSGVQLKGSTLRLEIAHYDSVIEGQLDASGDTFEGQWRRRAPGAQTEMATLGRRGLLHRFAAQAEPPAQVAGEWAMQFTEQDGTAFAGVAVLRAEADEVRGTILTDTGDYRFLEGQVVNQELRMSVFDGAHAFLFRAQLESIDGVDAPAQRMVGDFWSRDTYHATFTATRKSALTKGTAAAGLANPFEIVALTSTDGRMHFDFPMLPNAEDGWQDRPLRLLNDQDPRFTGKVVVVDIFGTWCPNCNDQAPLLAKWQRDYQGRGLEIVGIAFEFSGDPDKDMDMLQRYRDKYGIDYPLLLGGTSDKVLAGKQLPDLSRVAAYPTTVFIGRDGEVAKIYSGFSGPATGERHTQMLEAHQATLESLLGVAAADPAPPK